MKFIVSSFYFGSLEVHFLPFFCPSVVHNDRNAVEHFDISKIKIIIFKTYRQTNSNSDPQRLFH